MIEMTLKEISPEEYKEGLRKELDTEGLYHAVKKRCDTINEECKYMRYVQHRYIQEQLCEIMELVKVEGKPNDIIRSH